MNRERDQRRNVVIFLGQPFPENHECFRGVYWENEGKAGCQRANLRRNTFRNDRGTGPDRVLLLDQTDRKPTQTARKRKLGGSQEERSEHISLWPLTAILNCSIQLLIVILPP